MSEKTLEMRAVAFISPQNHPMLVKSFPSKPMKQDKPDKQEKQEKPDKQEDELKYHYIAHTSLDVMEERLAANPKATDCFLGMLYVLEDVCVYGYITPTRVKIVLALALTESFVKDADIILIFKALHSAYHDALRNPFLQQITVQEHSTEQVAQLMAKTDHNKWGAFKARLDTIAIAASQHASE